jgi:anti-sigma B factor antagonist
VFFSALQECIVSMQIEISRSEPEVVLVRLSGNLTRWDQRFIDDRFMDDLLGQGGQTLIIDLSAVDQMDSSGVHVLYEWSSVVRKASGELRFAGANARVARLFRVTRLDTVLRFYPSIAQASETLSPLPKA